ncbi:hypothetical protein Tco_0651632 [Tanacetum coccineum]|uniref:Uncharacterized protein n=1 Tax=Tanacetum coccineum TaxID=301880 RepID=A0ABQ4WVB6_9ASTR
MAQQIIPAAQLVPKFQGIRRCNNYVVLQSIPCSPEYKIVGKILLDHPLSYALTATADVPAVYLQQFWQTAHKVPGTKDTIRFKLNTQEITYTMGMFCDTLKLPVETPDNPFITPVTIETIESFMQTVGYQGVIDKLIIIDLMEKYPSIPRRLDEYYHSIKDDNLLVSVYSVGNVLFQGKRIPNAILTAEIYATDDYKEYETVFVGVDVPMNQPQPVVSTQGTHRNTPRAHRTPTLAAASPQGKKRKQRARETSSPRKPLKVTIRQKKQSKPSIPHPGDDRERDEVAEATILSLTLHKTALAAEAQENIAKVQEKLDEEEIERMVEDGEDKKSYASEFADSILNDDVDDSGEEDDEIEKEKKDDDVEKTNEVVKEKDNDEVASGSMEFRNETMQTPIPRLTRSPKIDLSSDKTTSKELTATVTPTTATTSKDLSIPKRKKRCHTRQRFFQEVLLACTDDVVVPKMTFSKTNEMIKEEMPRLVNLAVNKDCEVDPINVPELISKEFATHGPKMIEELFRKHMQNTTLNLYPTTSSSTAENQLLIFNNNYI